MQPSSRERILAAIACQQTDYTPLCFLLASELTRRAGSGAVLPFVRQQIERGIDALVPLPSVPSAPHPDVTTEVWSEPAEPYPLLHKVYHTPAGDLECIVEKAWDWPHGDDIPLMSDFVIPRARKFLVEEEQHVAAIEYLLPEPTAEQIEACRRQAKQLKEFARENGLATRAGFDRLADMACWLCGQVEFATMSLTAPDLLEGVLDAIWRHQRRRTEVLLELEPDILVKPEWYGTPFLSPALFRRFLGPALDESASMAHDAGAKLCYLTTSNVMPFLETLMDLGVDAVFGVDPVQGRWDLAEAKRICAGRMCLWGGINGYMHIVSGTEADVEAAVRNAMEVLAPGGGYIMAPVDDVRIEPSDPDREGTWARICRNIDRMIATWRSLQ